MNIKIGINILELRKMNGLTQEQLADYLNVSNAAISKWESGISYPDITLLPTIASIFKVSIDRLLGFDIEDISLEELQTKTKNYISEGKNSDAIKYLEEALHNYPNDLELNLSMARATLTKSLNSEPIDLELAKMSIYYFDKAYILDIEKKNRESILQNKSFLLASIGKFEKANDILLSLKNDKYTIQIANNLIKMGKFEEGMEKLQYYLNDFAFSFAWLSGNLKKCFEKFGRTKEAYDLTKLVATFREFFTYTNNANYYDFLVSKDFLDVAIEEYKLNKMEDMWIALEKSVNHAIRFDQNPTFELNKVYLMENLPGSFNNGNVGASKYLANKLKDKFTEFSKEDRFIKLITQLDKHNVE